MPEDNGKQNQNETYKNKFQKHVTCSYDYKLVCGNDSVSKPFKSYLGKDAVQSFIISMIEESKYFSEVIKKHVNKELGLTKEGNKEIKNSTKCWICDTDCADDDVKVRDRCHITRKYKSSAHRNCNINVKLNRKISVIFHDLQKLWFPSYYVRTINL